MAILHFLRAKCMSTNTVARSTSHMRAQGAPWTCSPVKLLKITKTHTYTNHLERFKGQIANEETSTQESQRFGKKSKILLNQDHFLPPLSRLSQAETLLQTSAAKNVGSLPRVPNAGFSPQEEQDIGVSHPSPRSLVLRLKHGGSLCCPALLMG